MCRGLTYPVFAFWFYPVLDCLCNNQTNRMVLLLRILRNSRVYCLRTISTAFPLTSITLRMNSASDYIGIYLIIIIQFLEYRYVCDGRLFQICSIWDKCISNWFGKQYRYLDGSCVIQREWWDLQCCGYIGNSDECCERVEPYLSCEFYVYDDS